MLSNAVRIMQKIAPITTFGLWLSTLKLLFYFSNSMHCNLYQGSFSKNKTKKNCIANIFIWEGPSIRPQQKGYLNPTSNLPSASTRLYIKNDFFWKRYVCPLSFICLLDLGVLTYVPALRAEEFQFPCRVMFGDSGHTEAAIIIYLRWHKHIRKILGSTTCFYNVLPKLQLWLLMVDFLRY